MEGMRRRRRADPLGIAQAKLYGSLSRLHSLEEEPSPSDHDRDRQRAELNETIATLTAKIRELGGDPRQTEYLVDQRRAEMTAVASGAAFSHLSGQRSHSRLR